jgi:hypothetical protein
MKPTTAAALSAIIAGGGEVNRTGTKIAMNTSVATDPRRPAIIPTTHCRWRLGRVMLG